VIAFDLGPKFSLGEIHVTTGAVAKLLPEDIDQAVRRHGRGDWGEGGLDGKQDNDMRVERGGTIASIYTSSGGANSTSSPRQIDLSPRFSYRTNIE
jgi:hypothetical protein